MTADITSWRLPPPNQLPLVLLALPWVMLPVLGSFYSRIPGGSILARHVGRHWSEPVDLDHSARSLEGGHGLNKYHFRVIELSAWKLWGRSLGPACS